jgi:hypothetical protein
MKTTEYILKELNEYYHNIPYQGLEGCHASPSLDRSEFYAYWGILRSLPKEGLSRAKDIIDKENYAEILSYVVKRVQEDKVKVYEKNKSVSVLLARYIDRKSKKVVESRKELLSRFEYLSFLDQKKIVIAFLKSAKRSDIDWAAEEAQKRWDRSYVGPIKEAFQNYDSYSLALTIIHHMPLDYLKEMESRLVMHNRSEYCMRFPDNADALMKKYDFNIFEILYVKARIGQKLLLSDRQVEMRFFRFIYTFAQMSVLEVCRGYQYVTEIPCLGRTLQALGELGYQDILLKFLSMRIYAKDNHIDNQSNSELYYAQKWIAEHYFPSAAVAGNMNLLQVKEAVDRFEAPKHIEVSNVDDLDEYDDLPPDIIDTIKDFI